MNEGIGTAYDRDVVCTGMLDMRGLSWGAVPLNTRRRCRSPETSARVASCDAEADREVPPVE